MIPPNGKEAPPLGSRGSSAPRGGSERDRGDVAPPLRWVRVEDDRPPASTDGAPLRGVWIDRRPQLAPVHLSVIKGAPDSQGRLPRAARRAPGGRRCRCGRGTIPGRPPRRSAIAPCAGRRSRRVVVCQCSSRPSIAPRSTVCADPGDVDLLARFPGIDPLDGVLVGLQAADPHLVIARLHHQDVPDRD